MARHTNEQVAHLFAHRQAGDSNNLHSNGTILKSYSTVIAFWHGTNLFISSDGMSVTTNGKHLSPLRYAARHLHPFYSPAFSWGRAGAPTPQECIVSAADEMPRLFAALCRSRVNMEDRIERYETRRAEILEYAERYDVQDLPTIPEATGDLKAKAKELEAKDRERRAEEKKRQDERERAQRIIDRGELDAWLQRGQGRYPHSFRTHGADQITIKDGKVVTSQGAEVPLDHVRKALAFYSGLERRACPKCGSLNRMTYGACACGESLLGVKRAFVAYHTNGHKLHLGAFVLDSIDEGGNVRAGCHTFTAQEIARFRAQWWAVLDAK